MSSPTPMIVVVGPTGSGKSDLALSLAEDLNGEVVNCDSVQLYRYLNVGTAKTPPQERRGIPHHLIDQLDPDQIFTAGDYARIGRAVLQEIASRGRVPVVAGGTGFYLRALLEGIFEGPGRDDAFRARLTERSSQRLHRLLTRFDPAAATRIHPNDKNKLIRALEVCILTRRTMTEQLQVNRRSLEGFVTLKIGLDPPRELLAARLNERCRLMFAHGILDETRTVLAMGFSKSAKALESIGYRQAVLHVTGQISLEEAVEDTQSSTRQYAKRQRTWFRREPDVLWLRAFGNDPQTVETAKNVSRQFLSEMRALQ